MHNVDIECNPSGLPLGAQAHVKTPSGVTFSVLENSSLTVKWGGCRLSRSEYWAQRNTDLVHTISKGERWAGIYEDAPGDDKASGGLLGLAVNCACAALYMVSRFPLSHFFLFCLANTLGGLHYLHRSHASQCYSPGDMTDNTLLVRRCRPTTS